MAVLFLFSNMNNELREKEEPRGFFCCDPNNEMRANLMTAATLSQAEVVVRPERDRNQAGHFSQSGKTPQMEDTMFETLMKFGGYRVDYLNKDRVGSSSAMGLYVLGDLPAHQSYSRMAKRNLFTGLCVIREQHEDQNLIAIYLDVNSPDDAHRPAYQQMKRDMKAGMFHRLCVPVVYDLVGSAEHYSDFWNFYRELEWMDILSTESGLLAPVCFQRLVQYPVAGAA